MEGMVLEDFSLPSRVWSVEILAGLGRRKLSYSVFPVVTWPPVTAMLVTEIQDQSLAVTFWVHETPVISYMAWIRNHYNIKFCWLVHVILCLSIFTFCLLSSSLLGRTLRITMFFLLFENNQSKHLLGVFSSFLSLDIQAVGILCVPDSDLGVVICSCPSI